jgi:membrane protein implicated in regulation of membrane protease activity
MASLPKNAEQEDGGGTMFAQTEWMVGFWLLPVVLFVVLPLAMLVLWGSTRIAKRAGEKSRALYEQQRESGKERSAENLESTVTA